MKGLLALVLAGLLLGGCAHPAERFPLREAMARAGVQPLRPAPQDPARVALGRALMFDKLLSGGRDVSCATCHSPLNHSSDGLSLAVGAGGHGFGPARTPGPSGFFARRTLNLFGRGLPGMDVFFADGHVRGRPETGFRTPKVSPLPPGLESALAVQALFPLTADVEMLGRDNDLARLKKGEAAIWSGLVARLKAVPGYRALFAAAYPQVPWEKVGIQHVANALAAFETESFAFTDTPFDRYLAGDEQALSEPQRRGAALFYGRARCARCHRGGLLSDLEFHNIAAPQVGTSHHGMDAGYYSQTFQAADRFKFRTPPLRNCALTPPYTHGGGLLTLEEVVRHHLDAARSFREYDGSRLGPGLVCRNREALQANLLGTLDPILRTPIRLSPQELKDLLAFVGEGLTDPRARDQRALVPASVPSGLPIEEP